MGWIKRLFGKSGEIHSPLSIPDRPADWNLTLDDLFAEMKAGKRKSVGNPEAAWAKEYERSLIPEGTRFPRKGDVYESKFDQTVHYMTAWNGPFTGGGEAVLFKGERVWVDNHPPDEKPIGAYTRPVEYAVLEKRMVSPAELRDPRYDGFYLYFNTVELNEKFTLIRMDFDGKSNNAEAGGHITETALDRQ